MIRQHTFHILEAYVYTEMMTAEVPYDPIFVLATLYDQLNKVPEVRDELRLAFASETQPLIDRLMEAMPEFDGLIIVETVDELIVDEKWRGLFESYLDYIEKKTK